MESNFVLDEFTEWVQKAGGIDFLAFKSSSTALEAAKAYAEIHRIGFEIHTPYDIYGSSLNVVMYISKEYEYHQGDLADALKDLQVEYGIYVEVIENTTPTESIILENGRTSMPDESPLNDLVMEQLEGNLSCDNAIIISEISSPKTQFPPGCIYDRLPLSVGAMIGYALAAPAKRLVACMKDLSIQAMKGEMPTMLKICGKSIIILVNTHLYTTNEDNGYTDIIKAMGKKPTKLWTSKVHTKKELGIAIRKANTEEMNKLCLTEVLIPADTMDPCCCICKRVIVDEEKVVSYGSCNHIFHDICMDKLLESGHTKCPEDRRVLAGQPKRWTIRTDKEADSDDELEVSPMLINIRPGSEIEKSCSYCSRPYRTMGVKRTSTECAHTHCLRCYKFVVDKCLVCHTHCARGRPRWSRTYVEEGEERVEGEESDEERDEESDEESVEEVEERVFSGLTFELINYLGEITLVREDYLVFQNVEPAWDEEEEIDEVPTWDEEEEIDEVPTRDEEEEIDEADAQLDQWQWFWEEGRYSRRRGVTL